MVRIASLIGFFMQLARIPFALYMCESVGDLDVYFLVVGASIPAQFFASEVLLYREIKLSAMGAGEIASIAVLGLSFLYMMTIHGWLVGLVYLLYIVSILALSVGMRGIRTTWGGRIYIYADVLFNIILSISVVASVFLSNDRKLSWCLLAVTILWGMIFAAAAKWISGSTPISSTHVHSKNYLNKNHSYYVQIGVMILTQLERMLIGSIWPSFLGYISISSAVCQAWRRLVLDDAVFYEQLKSSHIKSCIAYSALRSYIIFSLPVISISFAIYSLTNSAYTHTYLSDDKIDAIKSILPVLVIYYASLPFGIIGINFLRGMWASPKISKYYIAFVFMGLLFFLMLDGIYPEILTKKMVWFILLATGGVNIVVYMDSVNSSCARIVSIVWYLIIFNFAWWTIV